MTTVENEYLRVAIDPKGAELSSILHKPTGVEHLWQADPGVWAWHAPNLFPVVGGCLNNQLLIDGKTYAMERHGFARHSAFDVEDSSGPRAVFTLKANDKTWAVFPYEFNFQVSYELNGSQLTVAYRVVNTDEQSIYFSVGAHPAFAVPFSPGEAYEDYFIEFEREEPLVTHKLSSAGHFSGETEIVSTEANRLPLTKHLFDQDALVFKNLSSKRVVLRSNRHDRSVTVDYPDFPYLGLWAKPGAPFVCIEPWLGCADSEGQPVPIDRKELIQYSEPGGVFIAAFIITIA